jgi:hypothetical protein
MAGLLFNAPCPESAFSTSAKTMLVILAPANQRVKIREWSASFIGTSNAAQPIRVETYANATSLGTGTSIVPIKNNQADTESIQTTGNYNCSVEPTGTPGLDRTEEVHPQTGYTWQAPYGAETLVAGGQRYALRVTAAAGSSGAFRFSCEE